MSEERLEPTTVGDLRASQIGRRIRVVTDDATIEGALREIRVEQDWIEAPCATDGPGVDRKVPGRVTVTIAVGRWSCSSLSSAERAWWVDTPSAAVGR